MNIDPRTVEGFGQEWSRYPQDLLAPDEAAETFNEYFRVFPWDRLSPDAVGFDAGCGSGRWARLVAARVGRLHCVDASAEALGVARRNLAAVPNCEFHLASIDDLPLEDGSMDFGYSLGVLHHMPDTAAGLKACTAKLKRGAPFLVYLYYDFENRPWWFRRLWGASELLRRCISTFPFGLKAAFCQGISAIAYWPLARLAWAAEKAGLDVSHFPLAYYRHRSFYTMRTDTLDRLGTRLEHRFSSDEVRAMMTAADLERVTFSPAMPHWTAVGYKR